MAETKRKEGRPLKFENVEQLDSLLESYFADCEQRGEPPFFVEMCVWLDTCRDTLSEYAKKPEFSDSIKRAKLKCEAAIEKGMMTNKMNATGSIFNLKNNYGWEERIKQDNTHTVAPEVKEQIEQALSDL